VGPKAPIEEGMKTAQCASLAISRTFNILSILIFQAKVGLDSPTAERTATRLIIVSMLYFLTASITLSGSKASRFSQGPPSLISEIRG